MGTTTTDEKGYYEISFVVKKEYQGKGLGTQILMIVEREIKKNPNVTQHNKGKNLEKLTIEKMIAKHYSDNIASHKAFLKAGWYEAKIKEGKDKPTIDTPKLVWMMKRL